MLYETPVLVFDRLRLERERLEAAVDRHGLAEDVGRAAVERVPVLLGSSFLEVAAVAGVSVMLGRICLALVVMVLAQ